MAHLMCKNIPVYATRTKQVLEATLMPCPPEYYEQWRNSRQFLRGINRMPEEDERELGADSITVKRRLSLSDAYWVKYNKDGNANYDDINPYTNEFFEYGVCTSRKSSPSLTVAGSVNKSWKRVDNKTVLYKVMRPEWVTAEHAAVTLAKKLGLPVNDVTVISPTELHVHNFTTPDKMLMRLHLWDLRVKSQTKIPVNFGSTFSALDEVYARLGIQGNFHIITALFDSVVSNYDRVRNLSNLGYYKSSVTGENEHCPMFDFNLAHPFQKNIFLHIIKKQIADEHRAILSEWRPVIVEHGYSAWLDNVDELLSGGAL